MKSEPKNIIECLDYFKELLDEYQKLIYRTYPVIDLNDMPFTDTEEAASVTTTLFHRYFEHFDIWAYSNPGVKQEITTKAELIKERIEVPGGKHSFSVEQWGTKIEFNEDEQFFYNITIENICRCIYKIVVDDKLEFSDEFLFKDYSLIQLKNDFEEFYNESSGEFHDKAQQDGYILLDALIRKGAITIAAVAKYKLNRGLFRAEWAKYIKSKTSTNTSYKKSEIKYQDQPSDHRRLKKYIAIINLLPTSKK